MQTAYGFSRKRPEYGREMRQTGTDYTDANVCACRRLRSYSPYMSVLMTLDKNKTGRFGRECVQNLLTTRDSDGIGGWDRVVNDAHPLDANKKT